MYESWDELAEVDEFMMDDAEYVVTAWGTCARVAKTAIRALRAEGYKVGMIRPKTIFPFPKKAFAALDESKVKQIINFENAIPEQFLVDVKAALAEARKDIPIVSYTHGMGTCFTADEIEADLREVVK
jgi:2-oxoglutarate ferredoxin oxidoreductase subunit alpha